MIVAVQTLIYFRESLLTILERLIGPYYKRLRFSKNVTNSNLDDEDSEEQVFAEFDDEKGVVFYPPMYAQRYAAVNDCLLDERWSGKLEKVVDLGYHDMSFIKYLKEVPGVKHIIGVDIETVPLRCAPDLLAHGEHVPKRESPLQITLFEGNAADPDYRLIGCDAVVGIEMIEHMLPHDLDRLVHNIFGFIQPQIAVVTTPNSDFNILFKALENNGLRRWDHFFEWSREQFHDWCSNIVVRYPNYMVTCKGVGPGPPGTEHYGCCSQLALFISKDYHKQQDLTIDSMALVRNHPNDNALSDMEESWVHSDSVHEGNMICAPYDIESFSELPFPEKRSCMTIVIMTSPPIDTLEYRDNTSQCNIDKEIGRSYLMFDEDLSANVVVPRRRINNRIYEIEDVSSRLNCSMLQVRKFSKVTQNLMAKNKIDSIIQTREVVDEIRQLTKMLNYDKSAIDQQTKMYTWNNINWGENAPYWNQYYNVVRDYSYPFETKTEECRIVDLISDEINHLVDTQCPQEGSAGSEKIEIPLHYLMGVVEHITDDVDKVKDLLEWNGYEVVDNVVIHSRLAMENISMTTPDNECKDNDLYSDWDVTDMHSTSYSNASAISSQQNGKWLQRSLDTKVRKLRSLLTADEDITTELDRVVCRLMKLALKTNRNQDFPPPTTWLQCKLLDLLTLTERAIERRKRLLFNKNPLAVFAPEDYLQNRTLGRFSEMNNNDTKDIFEKYTNFVQETDNKDNFNITTSDFHRYVSLEVEDDISVTSNEFVKSYDYNNRENSSSSTSSDRNKGKIVKTRERNISSTKQYYKPDKYSGVSSSGDTDHSIKINHHKRCKKISKKCKQETDNEVRNIKISIIKDRKLKGNKRTTNEEHGGKNDRKRLLKRIIKKKSFCGYVFKNNQPSVECEHYKLRLKRKIRQHRHLKSLLNPTPNNLINEENVNAKKTFNELIKAICDKSGEPIFKSQESIAITEQSCVIELVTDKTSETISLRQTLTTDLNECCSRHSNQLLPIKSEARLDSVSILTKTANCSVSKLVLTAENEESQAIFLYDINEPSTSKGVRHVNMDVQCGPDTGFTCPFPSVSTSLSRNLINITESDAKKCEESFENIKSGDNKYSKDDNLISPRIRSNGIQIKDSDNAIKEKHENLSLTLIDNVTSVSESASQIVKKLDCHVFAVPDSSFNDSCVGNYLKIPSNSVIVANKTSGIIQAPKILPKEMNIINDIPFSNPIPKKLTRGGIYIHSYKDKIICEDIIYQGEWQRLRPKKLAKNNPFDIIFVKKNTEKNYNQNKNKHRLIHKNLQNSNVNSSCDKECQQNMDNIIVNKEQIIPRDLKRTVVSRKTIKCLNKNLKQVSSKVTVSSVLCKNARNTNEAERIVKTPQNTKREKKNKNLVKSYATKDLSPCKTVYIKNKLHKNINEHQALVVNECRVKDYKFLKNIKAINIKNELLKFVRDPRQTISYSVFRNKIEKETDSNRQSSPIKEIRNSKELKSIRNMQSANSSSSSTNSIATIRQLSPQSQIRRKLPSKIKVGNLPKTTSPIRRINAAECTKNTSLFDDKENDPQSSNFDNIQTKKDSTQDLDRSKSIVVLRNSISKHKNKPSNISIKRQHETTEKKFCTSSSSMSKKVSLADPIPNVVIKKQLNSDPNVSNLVVVLESYKKPLHLEDQKLTVNLLENENEKDLVPENNNVQELLVDDNGNYIIHDTPDIYNEMMALVEESLNLIGEHSYVKTSKIGQGKQLIQGERNKNCEKVHFNETSDNEIAGTSLNSGSSQVNVDLISFKSFASVSGYSEYFLANSELSATLDSLQTTISPKKSVHELFDRNDQARLPYSATAQGFSGFSINEQVIGDQPDYVNLIDSETGSIARGIDVRRATSEEVFTSGRSSDTYVSCQVDDDTLVPQWLFHAINQQHSEEENEPQRILLPMPVVEPDLDLNANILERGVVVGAGAGDGRGIHSDQDSSGRDTSMSSTESSSGQQSEAVLVDPSAYATNIEFLREPSSRPFFQLGSSASPDSSFRTVEGSENDNAYSMSAGSTRNDLNLGMIQSDRDADVSSLDTDIADFSDN